MSSIKKICLKAKRDYKRLSFKEMYRLAERFGEIEPKGGSRYNIYYPAGSPSPSMQLERPHGSRDDVPYRYKKEFYQLFADEIDEEVKNE
jgi:hypothetical protein